MKMKMNDEKQTGLKYIPEYESLKLIPDDQWVLFCTLTYKKASPPYADMLKDVTKLLRQFASTVTPGSGSSLVWFARVEETASMQRHVHLLLEKEKITDRTIIDAGEIGIEQWLLKNGFPAGPSARWTTEGIIKFLLERWEDIRGGVLRGKDRVKAFQEYHPTGEKMGLGYACKDRGGLQKHQYIPYLSTGLKKLITNHSPKEIL